MALVNTDFSSADNSIVKNMDLTLKWERAFAGYVNGLDQKNVALIDQSIAAMFVNRETVKLTVSLFIY
ncbi:hypothetical protein ACX2CJ_22085 [Bacillus subtilis]